MAMLTRTGGRPTDRGTDVVTGSLHWQEPPRSVARPGVVIRVAQHLLAGRCRDALVADEAAAGC
jgi:hypothetical protein